MSHRSARAQRLGREAEGNPPSFQEGEEANIWDRIFGSYAAETERFRYGLTKNIGTFNPLKANYHEFASMLRDVRQARSWRGRVGYLLQPPGWRESEAVERPGKTPVAA